MKRAIDLCQVVRSIRISTLQVEYKRGVLSIQGADMRRTEAGDIILVVSALNLSTQVRQSSSKNQHKATLFFELSPQFVVHWLTN